MIELRWGKTILAPEVEYKILKERELDIVLGSIHAVRINNLSIPFSCIDFFVTSKDFIIEYLHKYFNGMFFKIKTSDFDVLFHLTVSFRCINRKYNRNINVEEFYPQIETILREIVKMKKLSNSILLVKERFSSSG